MYENIVVGKTFQTKRSIPEAITLTYVKRIDNVNKDKVIVKTEFQLRGVYVGQEYLGECPIELSMLLKELTLIEKLEFFLERRIFNIQLMLAKL